MLTSTFTTDAHTQADGSRYVYERHTDVTGRVHTLLYRAPASWTSVEIEAVLAQRATQIDAQLAEAEALALMEHD